MDLTIFWYPFFTPIFSSANNFFHPKFLFDQTFLMQYTPIWTWEQSLTLAMAQLVFSTSRNWILNYPNQNTEHEHKLSNFFKTFLKYPSKIVRTPLKLSRHNLEPPLNLAWNTKQLSFPSRTPFLCFDNLKMRSKSSHLFFGGGRSSKKIHLLSFPLGKWLLHLTCFLYFQVHTPCTSKTLP